MTCSSIEIMIGSCQTESTAWPVTGIGSRPNRATMIRSSAGTFSPKRTAIRPMPAAASAQAALNSRPCPVPTLST